MGKWPSASLFAPSQDSEYVILGAEKCNSSGTIGDEDEVVRVSAGLYYVRASQSGIKE